MKRLPEPSSPGGRPLKESGRSAFSVATAALAAAWLLVPAVQYFATVQRTGLQLGGEAAYESLAGWDLTWLYLVLLVATLLYAALLALEARGDGRQSR